jgi:hypothetical protein
MYLTVQVGTAPHLYYLPLLVSTALGLHQLREAALRR